VGTGKKKDRSIDRLSSRIYRRGERATQPGKIEAASDSGGGNKVVADSEVTGCSGGAKGVVRPCKTNAKDVDALCRHIRVKGKTGEKQIECMRGKPREDERKLHSRQSTSISI